MKERRVDGVNEAFVDDVNPGLVDSGNLGGVDSVPPAPRRLGRVLLLGVLVVGLAIAGALYIDPEVWTPEYVRALGERGGVLGGLTFVGVWSLVNFVQVPSFVFACAALGLYGPWAGALVAWAGAQVVLTVVFVVTRVVGGSPLQGTQKPWLRRIMVHLERHPVRTIALARVVGWMSPAINYPVVLAGVRYRDYLLGSMLGLAPPIALLAGAWSLGWGGM